MRLAIVTLLALGALAAPAGGQPQPGGLEIQRNGSAPSGSGSAANFTGRVRTDGAFSAHPPSHYYGSFVTFEPGARTAWHSHPAGQTLLVTSGCGLVQAQGGPVEQIRPGDVIWTPPGVMHWHGASPTVAMTHIAIGETQGAEGVRWGEHVSDAQYGSAKFGSPC